jgi:hypothetical protein
LYEEHHERRVEVLVKDVLEIEDKAPSERIRTCELKRLINSLRRKKACGIDGILNECLSHLPKRPLVHLTHLFNHCLRLACHNTAQQCMRLTDQITMNFNNNISTAAVFLDIEKAFDTTWHLGLLYKISK